MFRIVRPRNGGAPAARLSRLADAGEHRRRIGERASEQFPDGGLALAVPSFARTQSSTNAATSNFADVGARSG
jgi:hypothetical protein